MLTRAAALAGLGALAASAALAQGALYSDDQLVAGWERMGRNIELVVTEDIPASLPREQRVAAAAISVVFETRLGHPLGFYSHPPSRSVVVPMESVLFLDDLAILTAWFEARGCRAEFIQTYLWALLRDGAPLPAPLAAFAVDRTIALADPFVEDVSSKILSSAIVYILAHEVGHLMLGHAGGVSGEASQAQEIAADAFALDYFATAGTAPLGATVYFLAARWLDPGQAVEEGTHPVSPARLQAIADRLAGDPLGFAHGEPDPERAATMTTYVAGEIASIADISGRAEVLEILPLGLARDFPLARLETACPS